MHQGSGRPQTRPNRPRGCDRPQPRPEGKTTQRQQVRCLPEPPRRPGRYAPHRTPARPARAGPQGPVPVVQVPSVPRQSSSAEPWCAPRVRTVRRVLPPMVRRVPRPLVPVSWGPPVSPQVTVPPAVRVRWPWRHLLSVARFVAHSLVLSVARFVVRVVVRVADQTRRLLARAARPQRSGRHRPDQHSDRTSVPLRCLLPSCQKRLRQPPRPVRPKASWPVAPPKPDPVRGHQIELSRRTHLARRAMDPLAPALRARMFQRYQQGP